jgi:hypothetical protein
MRRNKLLMLGAFVLGGLIVLSLVTFGVLSAASTGIKTASDPSTASGANSTAPPCNATGASPPTNSTGGPSGTNATGSPPPPPPGRPGGPPPPGNGSGLPPPPGCGARALPTPGTGLEGCGNMTAPSNETASDEDEDA